MMNLLDLNQVERSGILYIDNLIDSNNFASKAGDTISGNLNISGDLNVLGSVLGGTGVYLNSFDKKIGIGTKNPKYHIHLSGDNDSYLEIKPQNETGVKSSIVFSTNLLKNSGLLERSTDGNFNISGSQLTFSGKINSFNYKKTQSEDILEEIRLKNNSTISGFSFYTDTTGVVIDNFNLNTSYNVYYEAMLNAENGDYLGDISFYKGKDWAILDNITGWERSYFRSYNIFEDFGFDIKNDFKVYSSSDQIIVSGSVTGFNIQGTRYVFSTDLFGGSYNTPENFLPVFTGSVLKLQKEIDNFYTGEFTIYIKKQGDSKTVFYPTEVDYEGLVFIRTDTSRNPTGSNSIFSAFYTGGMFGEGYICLVQQNSGGYSAKKVDNGIFAGGIFLFDINTNSGDLDKNARLLTYYDTGLKLSNIYSSTNESSNLILNGDSTEITIEGGSILEYGLVDRKLNEDEYDRLIKTSRLQDSVFSGVKFLFKNRYSEDGVIRDVVNGYTGVILNQDNGVWK